MQEEKDKIQLIVFKVEKLIKDSLDEGIELGFNVEYLANQIAVKSIKFIYSEIEIL
ncbi:hypothetical protein JWG45_14510 [Leptospira sp. 201903070]|uniref:Uncharacterized protein n=1 Tax=Leptospira ainlahdjerensis TaxID=2810033 RepID=A0ABS2UDB2_9LEPT|nr:hypothetical protein [Leptospira ainlahdjerensis]MBM9578361.1 hypothetical protein [Leptospira ainlahdjerensis]